ncbi:hypothetical protein E2542_SST07109 [Spatholobus suberectus]|nr:hypothetical protein E2542_SST07109 [Spatholobus suberectus]
MSLRGTEAARKVREGVSDRNTEMEKSKEWDKDGRDLRGAELWKRRRECAMRDCVRQSNIQRRKTGAG